MVIARAELIASDGTRYVGYVYPSRDAGPGSVQPTIATANGQVMFWYGIVPPKETELTASYKLLGKTPDELFPLHFRAVVAYKGVNLDGELRGFMHYAPGGRSEVVEVR
jgi:hypothetical protein